jgi:hypothetical protein
LFFPEDSERALSDQLTRFSYAFGSSRRTPGMSSILSSTIEVSLRRKPAAIMSGSPVPCWFDVTPLASYRELLPEVAGAY